MYIPTYMRTILKFNYLIFNALFAFMGSMLRFSNRKILNPHHILHTGHWLNVGLLCKSMPLKSCHTEPVNSWARLSLCSALPLPANFHDDHFLLTSATSPAQVPEPLCGRSVRTGFLKVGLLLCRSPRGSRVDCALTIGAQRNLMEPMCSPIFLSVTRWPREHLFSIIPRHVLDEQIRSPRGSLFASSSHPATRCFYSAHRRSAPFFLIWLISFIVYFYHLIFFSISVLLPPLALATSWLSFPTSYHCSFPAIRPAAETHLH